MLLLVVAVLCLMIGATIGVVVAAICVAAGRADELNESVVQKEAVGV